MAQPMRGNLASRSKSSSEPRHWDRRVLGLGSWVLGLGLGSVHENEMRIRRVEQYRILACKVVVMVTVPIVVLMVMSMMMDMMMSMMMSMMMNMMVIMMMMKKKVLMMIIEIHEIMVTKITLSSFSIFVQ